MYFLLHLKELWLQNTVQILWIIQSNDHSTANTLDSSGREREKVLGYF